MEDISFTDHLLNAGDQDVAQLYFVVLHWNAIAVCPHALNDCFGYRSSH